MAVLATAMGSLNVIRAYLLSRHGMAALDMDSGFQQIFYTLVAVAAVVMTPVLVWMVFTRLSAQLKTLASTDALTGALNRHGLTEVLERHWRLVPGAAVVLLMIDIDHFKAINDQHGHPVGDAVLAMVARVIKAELGGMGHVARLEARSSPSSGWTATSRVPCAWPTGCAAPSRASASRPARCRAGR